MGDGGHLGEPLKKELAFVDIVVTARSVYGTSMPAFGESFNAQKLHHVASFMRKQMLPLLLVRSRCINSDRRHLASALESAPRMRAFRLTLKNYRCFPDSAPLRLEFRPGF